MGLKLVMFNRLPLCHATYLRGAGHCIEEEWLPSFGLFPNPRMTDTNTKEMHLKPENYVKQTVGELELWICLLSKRITNKSTNTNLGRAKVGAK